VWTRKYEATHQARASDISEPTLSEAAADGETLNSSSEENDAASTIDQHGGCTDGSDAASANENAENISTHEEDPAGAPCSGGEPNSAAAEQAIEADPEASANQSGDDPEVLLAAESDLAEVPSERVIAASTSRRDNQLLVQRCVLL
jgi:hypothetical protein